MDGMECPYKDLLVLVAVPESSSSATGRNLEEISVTVARRESDPATESDACGTS